MRDKTILIIGAGVAGLAAGCYAQMNGFRSIIYELHHIPGGLCTSWSRQGYTFDGCIHYLFGSGEGQAFNRMWQELGAIQGVDMIHHDEYQRVTDGEHTLVVYTDPDRLEAHMLDLAPEDAPRIRALCAGVRQFTQFDLSAMYEKPRSLMTPQDWRAYGMKMLPYMKPLLRWATVSAKAFGARFKNPFLRRAVPQMFSWEEAPVMMGMSLLAYMHTGNAAFPACGSLDFAKRLERRYLDLGGTIYYKTPVEKILTENGRASGVRLYNDEVHTADYVVSAADGRSTIFDMLGGEHTNRRIRRMYDGHLAMHSQVQVSLGVDRDFCHEPHWTTYLLNDPLLMIGEERYEISLKHYCFAPHFAPEGKSVLGAMIRSSYGYWSNIYGRRLYDTEQRQVTDIMLDYLEQWHPGLRGDVEVMDEATPLSYERFTNNWLGSTCGWLLSKDTMPLLVKGVKKTLPGLDRFYMAGQWVEPGGSVPLAAASGRAAVQLICADEKQPFHSAVPRLVYA